jgi:hypothetical protein
MASTSGHTKSDNVRTVTRSGRQLILSTKAKRAQANDGLIAEALGEDSSASAGPSRFSTDRDHGFVAPTSEKKRTERHATSSESEFVQDNLNDRGAEADDDLELVAQDEEVLAPVPPYREDVEDDLSVPRKGLKRPITKRTDYKTHGEKGKNINKRKKTTQEGVKTTELKQSGRSAAVGGVKDEFLSAKVLNLNRVFGDADESDLILTCRQDGRLILIQRAGTRMTSTRPRSIPSVATSSIISSSRSRTTPSYGVCSESFSDPQRGLALSDDRVL